jgi:hypothetical protein
MLKNAFTENRVLFVLFAIFVDNGCFGRDDRKSGLTGGNLPMDIPSPSCPSHFS